MGNPHVTLAWQSVSVIRLIVENKLAVTVERTSRKSDLAQEMCCLCVTDSLVGEAVEDQNFAYKKHPQSA